MNEDTLDKLFREAIEAIAAGDFETARIRNQQMAQLSGAIND